VEGEGETTRLRVTVNGETRYVAGLDARGHIGTHVIAQAGDSNEAFVESSGHDTTDQKVTPRDPVECR